MAKNDFLSTLIPDQVDDETWDQESKARNAEENRKRNSIRDFWMRDGDMPKLVTFLNEGKQFFLHSHWQRGKAVQYFLCRSRTGECEFCDTGKSASRYVVYALIDWFYYNDKGERVERPEVKLMIRGKDDYKLLEARKHNPRQGDGTLLGRKWEVIRTGNKYDFMADAEVEIPWDETIMYKRKSDGAEIEIPLIKTYDWPEYPVNDESIWSRANVRDTYPPMDWSNPKMVDQWITAHLANVPFTQYAATVGAETNARKGGGSKAHARSERNAPAVDDDSLPF